MKLRDEGHTVDVRRMDLTLATLLATLHLWRHAIALKCERCAWRLQVRVTWEADDVERFTKEALDAGVNTIVAAGGLCTCAWFITNSLHAPHAQKLHAMRS
jgi:hypothetical protein